MKLTAIALAAAFALSGTAVMANTVHHKSAVRVEPNVVSMMQLHRAGGRNGNPDGPSTLSGTGGADGDRDGWPNDMILD